MYKYIEVNEIDDKYISEDCCQIMIPFDKSLSVFDEKGLTFYGRGYKENIINNSRYIEDERKKQFPYNDIPYHYTKKNLFTKILYVNQLFDFNKTYIILNNGILSQYYIIKKESKAYIIQTDFGLDVEDCIIEREVRKDNIYQFFGWLMEPAYNKKTYIVDSTGKHLNICFDENERNQKRKKLIEFLKYEKLLHSYDENNIYYQGSEYIKEDNFMLPFDNPLFVINLSNNEIQIKYIELTSINDTTAKIKSYNIPVQKYCLEQINNILNNSPKKLEEPKKLILKRKK